MSYAAVVSRADAAGLIPQPIASTIIEAITQASAALQLFRQVELSSGTSRLPVVSLLPSAYWVSPTDTGLKQTTEANWTDVLMTVEEIAAIVTVPQSVFNDSQFDMWAQLRPMLADAVGRVLDDTIFFGTGAPASWTGANIVAKAVAASNFVNLGTATAPAGLLGDISLTFAKVEEDGFDVKAAVSKAATRGALRAAMITSEAMAAQATTNEVWGVPITYAMGGLWPTSANAAQLIAGDFSQGVLGVRQDITYTTFDQGVITDAAGVVVQNLMQQDLVAIRVVARYAFAVPNPVTRDNANASTRYPFAVLRNAT